MRRTWAILLLAVGAARPVRAATPVTVAQLQKCLDDARGKPDGKVAGQLSKLELTERISSAQLARWLVEFPGKRTHEALTALADTSAFFNPPAPGIRSDPAPDLTAQHEFLSEAIEYAGKALSRLPNFYATRETVHFEDTLPKQTYQQPVSGAGRSSMRSMSLAAPVAASVLEYEPLHRTRVYSVQVRYRDGAEVRGPQEAKGAVRDRQDAGLTTSGEFGPILYIVLEDSVNGKIVWDHWEQGAGGPLAVFRYTVPQPDSHYMVQMQHVNGAEQLFPAYHGEIAIDPANGTIVRISAVSDMAPPYEIVQAAILVEYGPVAIGERTYVCPVHGVALSRMPAVASDSGELQAASLQTQVNDVSFKDYHLFRGDARILSGSAPAPAPAAPPHVQ